MFFLCYCSHQSPPIHAQSSCLRTPVSHFVLDCLCIGGDWFHRCKYRFFPLHASMTVQNLYLTSGVNSNFLSFPLLRPDTVSLSQFQTVQGHFFFSIFHFCICSLFKQMDLLQLIRFLKLDSAHADCTFFLFRNLCCQNLKKYPSLVCSTIF